MQQDVHGDLDDGLADALPGALVRTALNARCAWLPCTETSGVRPDLGVEVARREAEDQQVALLDLVTAEFEVAGGEPPRQDGQRRASST